MARLAQYENVSDSGVFHTPRLWNGRALRWQQIYCLGTLLSWTESLPADPCSPSLVDMWDMIAGLRKAQYENGREESMCAGRWLRLFTFAVLAALAIPFSVVPPAAGDGDQLDVPEKVDLKYPNLGSALDQLVTRVGAGQASAQEAAQDAAVHREESVAATIYLSSTTVADYRFGTPIRAPELWLAPPLVGRSHQPVSGTCHYRDQSTLPFIICDCSTSHVWNQAVQFSSGVPWMPVDGGSPIALLPGHSSVAEPPRQGTALEATASTLNSISAMFNQLPCLGV